MLDLIVKNAHLIDPLNQLNGCFSVGIADGKIKIVEDQIKESAKETIDAEGKLLIPGLIDMHTHIRTLWGSGHGQRMLALAGVTTTLDMAGPLENILSTLSTSGAGLNIAIVESAHTMTEMYGENPSSADVKSFTEKVLEQGALGVKLMGGHYPMSLALSDAVIEACHQKKAWVAWHVGNTLHGSNIEGFRDAIALSKGRFIHLAHINSYCRGQVLTPEAEALEAIELLKQNPQCFSESYISPFNGTSLDIENGLPVSHVTRTALTLCGFTPDEDGVRQALMQSKVGVLFDNGTVSTLIYAQEAFDYWLLNKTHVRASFAVNPASSRMLLASAKRDDHSFVVDAISTDGGAYPRNEILSKGLSLVKFGALSLEEFVVKTSLMPARWLRLPQKGHLSVGADADITLVDFEKQCAFMTICNGEIIMRDQKPIGKNSFVLCHSKGEKALRERGIPCRSLRLEEPAPKRFCF